jgi:hypothetical protein
MRKPLPLIALLLPVFVMASCTAYYGPPPPPPRVVYTAPPPPVVYRVPPPQPVYQAPPTDNTAVGTFYGALSPYGEWVVTARYGQCWHPYGIAVGWRPYTDGYWALTDYGWTFVSTAPWSWACYHYGRWFYDSRAGWLWYPDVEWAPAWVVWRTGGDYIGWCPIPPGVAVADFGFASGGFSVDVAFPSFAFSFVRFEDFDRDDVHRFIIAPSRNVTIIRQTNIFVGIGHEHGHMVNRFHDERGFEARIEHSSRRAIPRYRVSDRREPGPPEVSRNEVRMFRPDLRRPEDREQMRRYSPQGRGPAPREATTRREAPSRGDGRGRDGERRDDPSGDGGGNPGDR